jgi:hypothetical protein
MPSERAPAVVIEPLLTSAKAFVLLPPLPPLPPTATEKPSELPTVSVPATLRPPVPPPPPPPPPAAATLPPTAMPPSTPVAPLAEIAKPPLPPPPMLCTVMPGEDAPKVVTELQQNCGMAKFVVL